MSLKVGFINEKGASHLQTKSSGQKKDLTLKRILEFQHFFCYEDHFERHLNLKDYF